MPAGAGASPAGVLGRSGAAFGSTPTVQCRHAFYLVLKVLRVVPRVLFSAPGGNDIALLPCAR